MPEQSVAPAPAPMGMMRPADPIAGAEAAAKRAYHAQLYEESVLELQAGVERVRQWHGPRTFKSTRATVIIGRKVRSEYMDWNWSRPKDGGDARPTPAALVDLDAMLPERRAAGARRDGWLGPHGRPELLLLPVCLHDRAVPRRVRSANLLFV